ncbi:MAG: acyl carrier protein [Saprospiraceae bacterium]|jgi:acyl carrier protein|tara:strand:+ start:548 stop:778 length:231 start_codon:yes stop_codon:yes gene_type:complete
MKIDDFIKLLEEEFEEEYPEGVSPETNFRELPDWGSMQALIVTALVETEFEVTLTATDLKQLTTIEDLFNLVKSRM